jgi:hypothetical protein
MHVYCRALGRWFGLWLARFLSQKFPKRCSWMRAFAPLVACVVGIFIAANWPYFNGCTFQPCSNATNATGVRPALRTLHSWPC